MNTLDQAVKAVLERQRASCKPLAVVLAGHNGSGKSTLWYGRLAPRLQIPLINADRMMMSILPEVEAGQALPAWASRLRDKDENWMRVAQNGVQAFVSHAMVNKVPFAMETVFSHWLKRADGTFDSKITLIRQMQDAGYFVLLVFVGLTNSDLSVARVDTRMASGGHAVPLGKLRSRFGRTQQAMRAAVPVADAALLLDNSRTPRQAFTVCRVQLGQAVVFDRRDMHRRLPPEVAAWLDVVSPQ